jgi:hypothetical protein
MAWNRVFEKIFEVIGWILIVLSPLGLGLLGGWILYYYLGGMSGIIFGFSFALLGLILGIRWANKAYKGKGTISLLSRVSATPELDEPEKKED